SCCGNEQAPQWRSRPFHHRGHRREDRLDIAAGAQAEDRSAVVEQVEFDVAAAPDQLLFALVFIPARRIIAADELWIDIEELAPHLLSESEVLVPVSRLEIIVEDPTDAAHFVAVLEEEIVVAPRFIFRI